MFADLIFAPIASRFNRQLVTGSKRPKGKKLAPWQKEERRQVSQQRGMINLTMTLTTLGYWERNFGQVCTKFAVIRKKFRHSEAWIKPTLSNCLALYNIDKFPKIVQHHILQFDDEEWQAFMDEHEVFFDEKIVVIKSQVIN